MAQSFLTFCLVFQTLDRVEAGNRAGILIKNVKEDEMIRRIAAVKAETLQPTRGVLATIYMLSKKELTKDRSLPLISGKDFTMLFKT